MAAADSESLKTTIAAYTSMTTSAGTDTTLRIFIQLMPKTAVRHMMRPHMTVESQPGMGRPIVARIPAKASPQTTAWKPNQQMKQKAIMKETT